MVKFAIIGAGFIAHSHVDAIKNMDNAKIVAIADKVEQKGKELAASCGAQYYSDIEDVLKIPDLDCVNICVPTFLHKDMVLKVLDSGKNVFCEKPLAISLEEADQMVEAAQKSGLKAMVGQALRFWPEYVAIKKYVESGELGKPLHAFCQRLAVTPDWHQNNWGATEKYGGGAALDLHIHDLDYVRWLFGSPEVVMAQGIYDPVAKEEGGLVHIATTVEFKNKVGVLAEGGWEFKGAFPFTMILRILLEKGTIEWIFRAGKNIEERGEAIDIQVYKNDGSIDTIDVEAGDAFFLELSYLVDCLESGKPIENATFKDGRDSLELALAAIKSAKEHRAIKL